MRRTRFMSWFFLILALGFFLVPEFRHALEAPLANFWSSRYKNLHTLDRYVSPKKLLTLANEALQKGDNQFVAFAALNLPVNNRGYLLQAVALADGAVKRDPTLTWVYFPLVVRFIRFGDWTHSSKDLEETIPPLLAKLENFDGENGATHWLHAHFIATLRGKDWPQPKPSSADPEYLKLLAAETEWTKQMEATFTAPHFNHYGPRQIELYRDVMRERGWDHPAVVQQRLVTGVPSPNYRWPRDYANLLVLKNGAELEAAGQLDKALGIYWRTVQFGQRMQVEESNLIGQLIGVAIEMIASPRLAPALRKANQQDEARVVEQTKPQLLSHLKRGRSDRTGANNNPWWTLLVNLSAGLVAIFLPLALIAVVYVNAKLWIRKEKKGRLYEILTILENYAPILLFVSCCALHFTYAPLPRGSPTSSNRRRPLR